VEICFFDGNMKKHREWRYLVDFEGNEDEAYSFAIIQVEPSLGLKAYIPLKGHKFFEHSQLTEGMGGKQNG